jgi:hypothetical protein
MKLPTRCNSSLPRKEDDLLRISVEIVCGNLEMIYQALPPRDCHYCTGRKTTAAAGIAKKLHHSFVASPRRNWN